MKEHKTIGVVTDAILNDMVNAGWAIVHLQFDGVLLRGVFVRDVEAPVSEGVPMVVKPVVTVGHVAQVVNQPVGTDEAIYNVRPMRPVSVGKLKVIGKETPEETIRRLDDELVNRVTNWVAQNVTPYQPTQQPLLCEVNS